MRTRERDLARRRELFQRTMGEGWRVAVRLGEVVVGLTALIIMVLAVKALIGAALAGTLQ